MNAHQLYQAGRLREAITAVTAEVKSKPTDLDRRGLLCELLCFAGELERADTQLDVIAHQDPTANVGVSLWRQLIRAEQARRQFHSEGRLPDFLDQPTPVQRLHLEASILLRDGKASEAAQVLARAEEQRPHVAGTCDGKPFDDLRDLDDLTASSFEVLTSTGKYYWIPLERVELVELRTPARPRDLLWRQAHMIVKDGPDGEVYLPAIYASTYAEQDEALLLGRATDWRGGNGAPMRGLGLRTFLIGEEDRTILQIETITPT
jgi:type VI secretion system protein ImpE